MEMKLREHKSINNHINNSIHKSHRIEAKRSIDRSKVTQAYKSKKKNNEKKNFRNNENRLIWFWACVCAFLSLSSAFHDFTDDWTDWIAYSCTRIARTINEWLCIIIITSAIRYVWARKSYQYTYILDVSCAFLLFFFMCDDYASSAHHFQLRSAQHTQIYTHKHLTLNLIYLTIPNGLTLERITKNYRPHCHLIAQSHPKIQNQIRQLIGLITIKTLI